MASMFDVLDKVLSAKPIQYHFEEPALYQPKLKNVFGTTKNVVLAQKSKNR